MDYLWSLWTFLRPWVVWAWDWIKANHEPLTPVLTFLGVLVAWRYVVLTRRLAEAANIQAVAAREQAVAATEQAEAGRIAVQAAAEQATVTRQAFEAAQRPYLAATILNQSVVTSGDTLHVTFMIKNYGPIPAMVVGWRVAIMIGGSLVAERPAESGDARICVFPQLYVQLDWQQGKPGMIQDAREPVEVELSVDYRGSPAGPIYRTGIRRTGRHGWWDGTYVAVT